MNHYVPVQRLIHKCMKTKIKTNHYFWLEKHIKYEKIHCMFIFFCFPRECFPKIAATKKKTPPWQFFLNKQKFKNMTCIVGPVFGFLHTSPHRLRVFSHLLLQENQVKKILYSISNCVIFIIINQILNLFSNQHVMCVPQSM